MLHVVFAYFLRILVEYVGGFSPRLFANLREGEGKVAASGSGKRISGWTMDDEEWANDEGQGGWRGRSREYGMGCERMCGTGKMAGE